MVFRFKSKKPQSEQEQKQAFQNALTNAGDHKLSAEASGKLALKTFVYTFAAASLLATGGFIGVPLTLAVLKGATLISGAFSSMAAGFKVAGDHQESIAKGYSNKLGVPMPDNAQIMDEARGRYENTKRKDMSPG